ncbi:MAG: hypothetical protein J0I41_08370 [Filimonas sp.]|nr:hypothetical protein [Filimonas sp.]
MRIYFTFFAILLSAVSFSQDLQKANLPDTILKTNRTLIMPDSLDAMAALRKLFPGKFYSLGDKKAKNELISWECKSCAATTYNDVNEIEGPQQFPYKEGVATRLLSVINYTDAKGNRFKLVAFNHSVYDEDGLQTSRFSGGLVGVAKFSKFPGGWEMKSFEPAIAAYGAFSSAPSLKPLQIGEDQYAFTLLHYNGGGGGPAYGTLYMIGGYDGRYRQLLDAYQYGLINNGDNGTHWSGTVSVKDVSKQFFRDISVTIKGTYVAPAAGEDNPIPSELKNMIAGRKKFDFTIERTYVHKGSKGYVQSGEGKAVVSNVK